MEKTGKGLFKTNRSYEKIITKGIISGIDFYKKAISPYLPHTCRYYPTCSEYSKEAILKYGPLKGGLKAAWRIIRCNPFSKGGYDPVR